MKERMKFIRELILLTICLMLVGCRKDIPIASEVQETQGYKFGETMVIVATERNRYEAIYSDQIWSVVLEDGETTFETYLLDQVQTFIQDIRTMTLLAEKKGVSLNSSEEEQLKLLSKEFYSSLTDADKAYMQCTQDDVLNIYSEYYLANKVVGELTKDVDLEISANEAKVIELYQIILNDQETANQVYEYLQQEEVDVKTVTQTFQVDSMILRQLGRGEEPEAYEAIAFSLATGEMSEIVHRDDQYYILWCVNDYDQEATKKRKEEIYTAKRNQVFRQIYQQFVEEYPIEIQDHVWQNISCITEYDTTTKNFFELYHEKFSS